MAAPPRKKSGITLSVLPLWLMGAPDWPAGQLYLSVSLFLAEMVAGRVTASLLLQVCAFHTLEGTLALAVSLLDARLPAGSHPTWKNTFGWARAPIVGTLVSAVFLSALCVALLAEALRRIAEPRLPEHPLALMGIGALAIPIHLAREGLPRKHPPKLDIGPCCNKRSLPQGRKQEKEDLLGNGSSSHKPPWLEERREGPWQTLYLRWMVACFGPVAVFLYSLTVHLLWTPCLGQAVCLDHCFRNPCRPWETPDVLPQLSVACWPLYVDPGLAVVAAVALLCLVWPTLRASALVLLQAAPEGLDLWLLEQRLRATEGVATVRELHVWQLDGHRSSVATAHVDCLDVAVYEPVVRRVKRVFCEHGIHVVTVEPHPGRRPNEGHRQGPRERQLGPAPTELLEFETSV
ncbi:zinc transporter 1-like [Python bivittatus]|uniref:Zinc transporter 1-like n=1 Tax=Python bivittatus TaxID=176946 RepID=A0A9F5MY52_PYTBI|nr:zinc transporter 1-like [Python bivittatus]